MNAKKEIILKGQSLDKWEVWLKNELVKDGRENRVFNLDNMKEARSIYEHVIEAFLELVRAVK